MVYKLGSYDGCGCCKHAKDCKTATHRKDVKIEFLKRQLWDNCGGGYSTAFRKGDVVVGSANIDNEDNTVLCADAESTLYTGINDFIDIDEGMVIITDVED